VPLFELCLRLSIRLNSWSRAASFETTEIRQYSDACNSRHAAVARGFFIRFSAICFVVLPFCADPGSVGGANSEQPLLDPHAAGLPLACWCEGGGAASRDTPTLPLPRRLYTTRYNSLSFRLYPRSRWPCVCCGTSFLQLVSTRSPTQRVVAYGGLGSLPCSPRISQGSSLNTVAYTLLKCHSSGPHAGVLRTHLASVPCALHFVFASRSRSPASRMPPTVFTPASWRPSA
jgi:hypothetical protein